MSNQTQETPQTQTQELIDALNLILMAQRDIGFFFDNRFDQVRHPVIEPVAIERKGGKFLMYAPTYTAKLKVTSNGVELVKPGGRFEEPRRLVFEGEEVTQAIRKMFANLVMPMDCVAVEIHNAVVHMCDDDENNRYTFVTTLNYTMRVDMSKEDLPSLPRVKIEVVKGSVAKLLYLFFLPWPSIPRWFE